MGSALTRFRVMAYVVGVVLLLLVLVAMPVKYIGGNESLVAVIGPVHGFLYMAYLLVALDLAVRCRWSIGRSLLVLVAGTVPFVSFVAERKVTRLVRERHERDGAADTADARV